MQTKIEKISPYSALAINNILEVAEIDTEFLSFREKLTFANISHAGKKIEWKGARIAVKHALECISMPYPGFFKDEHGKSQPMDECGFVSLTHTKGYAAAIFHKEMPVGIDMDFVRTKIISLGPKYLDPIEMEFLEQDPMLYTIAWSAKESIYKCQGKKGVSLRKNILLSPFSLENLLIEGKIRNTINSDHNYRVKVEHWEDMVLTYTVW